jgi:hypothetical protein
MEFSKECALFETGEVTGSFVAECGELNGLGVYVGGDCATHRVTQLIQQAPPELFTGDVLKFGKNEALLDGITSAKLGAPLEGESWGGVV